MRVAAACALSLILACAAEASQASDLSSMYDRKTLDHGRDQYKQNIESIWKKDIAAHLTSTEKNLFNGVTLQFPDYDGEGNPFRFRAARDRTVIVPIFVVKFLDDLAIAGSWLAENPGKGHRGIEEYVSLLKYRESVDFPNRRYHTPLAGVGVPDRVLEDKRVDLMARLILKSYVLFLLAREIAELYPIDLEDSAGDIQVSPSKTALADAFALEILRRMSVPPTGLCFYMVVESYYIPNAADMKSLLDADSPAGPLSKFVQGFSSRQMRELASILVQRKEDFIRFAPNRKAAGTEIETCVQRLVQSGRALDSELTQKQIRVRAINDSLRSARP